MQTFRTLQYQSSPYLAKIRGKPISAASLKMKTSTSDSTLSVLVLTALLLSTHADPVPVPAPAPLIIEGGTTPTSTKTVTVTAGVVVPDTTITVDSIGIDDSLHTTLSGSAATSYLLSQSASISSRNCDELAEHGVQCTSVTTVTTTVDASGAASQTSASANSGLGHAAGIPFFKKMHQAKGGVLSIEFSLQAAVAVLLAGGCGVFAFML